MVVVGHVQPTDWTDFWGTPEKWMVIYRSTAESVLRWERRQSARGNLALGVLVDRLDWDLIIRRTRGWLTAGKMHKAIRDASDMD